jgi:hypothetical protein
MAVDVVSMMRLGDFKRIRPRLGSNHFNQERSLTSRASFKLNRAAALAEWRQLCAA